MQPAKKKKWKEARLRSKNCLYLQKRDHLWRNIRECPEKPLKLVNQPTTVGGYHVQKSIVILYTSNKKLNPFKNTIHNYEKLWNKDKSDKIGNYKARKHCWEKSESYKLKEMPL